MQDFKNILHLIWMFHIFFILLSYALMYFRSEIKRKKRVFLLYFTQIVSLQVNSQY